MFRENAPLFILKVSLWLHNLNTFFSWAKWAFLIFINLHSLVLWKHILNDTQLLACCLLLLRKPWVLFYFSKILSHYFNAAMLHCSRCSSGRPRRFRGFNSFIKLVYWLYRRFVQRFRLLMSRAVHWEIWRCILLNLNSAISCILFFGLDLILRQQRLLYLQEFIEFFWKSAQVLLSLLMLLKFLEVMEIWII